MKKVLFITLISIALFSCKNGKNNGTEKEAVTTEETDRTDKQSDGLTLLKGDFIYYADAAVLQTHREVYGVVIDEKMHELNEKVAEFKTEVTDMVPVEIRGKIVPKPANEEGWAFRVEIKEILNVSRPEPDENRVINIGE